VAFIVGHSVSLEVDGKLARECLHRHARMHAAPCEIKIDKIDLDYTEARDSEWQWNQLGHMQVCTSLKTDNYTSTPQLCFLQAGCPSCHPTNSVKALKAQA